MICCFRSSSRHAIQTGVSELKIISLYLVMVSLIASSIYSFVFIRFRRRIFNFFSSYNPPIRLQKSFKPSCFYTSKKPIIIIIIIIIIITQHTALLVFCINIFSHVPEDDNFYLVCIQNQSLRQSLHCNAYYMEHLDYENLSLCVLSTFSTCH